MSILYLWTTKAYVLIIMDCSSTSNYAVGGATRLIIFWTEWMKWLHIRGWDTLSDRSSIWGAALSSLICHKVQIGAEVEPWAGILMLFHIGRLEYFRAWEGAWKWTFLWRWAGCEAIIEGLILVWNSGIIYLSSPILSVHHEFFPGIVAKKTVRLTVSPLILSHCLSVWTLSKALASSQWKAHPLILITLSFLLFF